MNGIFEHYLEEFQTSQCLQQQLQRQV